MLEKIQKYIKNLTVEAVLVFSLFIKEPTRTKIPSIFVYFCLIILMVSLTVFHLIQFIWTLIFVVLFEDIDDEEH